MAASVMALGLVMMATPAWAHGDEHDMHRIAQLDIDGMPVDVWSPDVPGQDGMLTVALTIADPAVREVAVVSAADSQPVPATRTSSGQWVSEVHVASDGPTALSVVVDGAAAGFVFALPTTTWWMKLIILAAIVHGLVCSRWLIGRFAKTFQRPTPVLA